MISTWPVGFELFVVVMVGLILGSFNTMLVYRIPRDLPLGLLKGHRSCCPSCKRVIPWFRNIPILGFVFGKGKCHSCKVKISSKYVWIELITALFFVLTWWGFLQQDTGRYLGWELWAEFSKVQFFTFALVCTTFIDLEFRIIPDRFSLGCWLIAWGGAWAWGVPDLMTSFFGGLLGAGMFGLMAWGYYKIKGVEGLGMGDVKMMGWLGSWLGVLAVPHLVLGASLSGLIVGYFVGRRTGEGLQAAIPFGPFLALSAWVIWLCQCVGALPF